MTETSVKPTPIRPASQPDPDGKDGGGKSPVDRAWDVTAIVAGVALGVILFDILHPRHPVSRLLSRKRGGGEAGDKPDAGPCEDC